MRSKPSEFILLTTIEVFSKRGPFRKMKAEFIKQPGWKITDEIKRGEISAQEYVSYLFKRIEEKDEALNAYITLMKEQALEQARNLDKKIKNRESVGRLAGLGVAVKDNIWIRGVETTCASRALRGYVPPDTATVVQRIEAEDGIILGKSNLEEFADGYRYGYGCFGPTRNPWDLTRYPGGSSGGSAVAVATYMATLGLGSDTGGSVRSPAGFCSILGLKPTYGLVSRYGLVPFAETLDTVGPMARDARDCALLLSVMAGPDRKDTASTKKKPEDYTGYLEGGIDGVRIAVPKELFDNAQKPVQMAVWKAICELEDLGANCTEVSMKLLRYARACFNCIQAVEGFPNLSPYAHKGLGSEPKSQVILGYFLLTERRLYEQAAKVRTLLTKEFHEIFKKFDAIAAPTNATLPVKLWERKRDPEPAMVGVALPNRAVANLTGMPALSVPCGFYRHLPIGLQLIASHYREGLLLKMAYTYEQRMPIVKSQFSSMTS